MPDLGATNHMHLMSSTQKCKKKHSGDFLLCNLTFSITLNMTHEFSSLTFNFCLRSIFHFIFKVQHFLQKSTSLIIPHERKQIVNFIYFSGIYLEDKIQIIPKIHPSSVESLPSSDIKLGAFIDFN